MSEELGAVSLVVLGLLVIIAVAAATGKLGWSAPITLVTLGAAVSFIPGIPRVHVEPDWILIGVLPPLLFASALRTSIVDARARRDPIIFLSVVLVAYTVVVVGFATWAIVPSITLAAGLAFGAVVAPTDAVAVGAVTRRAPLPRVVTTVLEGESLLNDATALAALNVTIAALTATVSVGQVAGGFAIAVLGGIGSGLLMGWLLGVVRSRLRASVLDTALSLAAPYVAFIPAQVLGGSGILAVVTAGLYLSYRSPSIQSPEARIAETLNWKTIGFLLDNAVFLVIGLSLAGIVDAAIETEIPVLTMVWICVLMLVLLLVSRLVWGLGLTAVFRFGPERFRRQSWHWHQTVVVSFAGVRGVVTLAAVFLLPDATPQRGFLQLLAFVVVIGTLLQSLLLPVLMRVLPSLVAPNLEQERTETRLLLAEAQLSGLQRVADLEASESPESLARLRADATFLSDSLQNGGPDQEPAHEAYARLRKLTLEAERSAVLRARAARRFQEPSVRAVLRILDAEEVALDASRATSSDDD